MKIRIAVLFGAILLACSIIGTGSAQSQNGHSINLMINIDMPSSPTPDELDAAERGLRELYSAISRQHKVGTIFIPRDVALSNIKLVLAQYGVLSKFEFALAGNHTSDMYSSLPFSEQKNYLEDTWMAANSSRICGVNEIKIYGFIPPSFDQNEDTFKVIDSLGLKYDAGFQAGLIYLPGHENDVKPYKAEGYSFYAVPISSSEALGQRLPLYDRHIKEEAGMNGDQWLNILKSKLDQASEKDEPMVVLLSTSISGSGEFLESLKKFIEYAISKNSAFVTTIDLVRMSNPSDIPTEETEECTVCEEGEGLNISIKRINLTNSTDTQAVS